MAQKWCRTNKGILLSVHTGRAHRTASNPNVAPGERYQSLGGLEAEFRSVLRTHAEHPLGATHCAEGEGDIEKS